MIGYAIRRILLALSLVWAVSFFGFIAFALTFDPLWQQRMCGPPCAHQVKVLTIQYHLNKSVLERYWIWLSDFVGHGFSFRAIGGYPINAQLLDATKVTTELMACALLVTALFAVGVGVASARRAGRPLDFLLRGLAYVAWSLPAFLIASVAVRWVVPSVSWFVLGGTPGLPPGVQGAPVHLPGGFVMWFRGMTLPVLTLSLGLIGLYSRYVRTALLTELHRPYAVVARSKGLSETRVAYRHALRNALPPFVSVLSLEIGAILGASLAIDYVFYMGGLASYFLGGLTQASDPYVLTAVVVAASCIVVLFMLVSDLAVGWLDPRTAATASR
jgi:peptide/nickel transport system permease protein